MPVVRMVNSLQPQTTHCQDVPGQGAPAPTREVQVADCRSVRATPRGAHGIEASWAPVGGQAARAIWQSGGFTVTDAPPTLTNAEAMSRVARVTSHETLRAAIRNRSKEVIRDVDGRTRAADPARV